MDSARALLARVVSAFASFVVVSIVVVLLAAAADVVVVAGDVAVVWLHAC